MKNQCSGETLVKIIQPGHHHAPPQPAKELQRPCPNTVAQVESAGQEDAAHTWDVAAKDRCVSSLPRA